METYGISIYSPFYSNVCYEQCSAHILCKLDTIHYNPRVAIIGGGPPPLPKGSRDEGVHIKGKWGVRIKRMIGGWAVKRRDDAVIWLSLSHPKP